MRLATGVHELEILKQMTILNKWNLLSLKFEEQDKKLEKEKAGNEKPQKDKPEKEEHE